MTGKELIMEIIDNNLLDETVYINDIFPGFIRDTEVAKKFGVGTPTIQVWCKQGFFEYFRTNKFYYIREKDLTDPRKRDNHDREKDISPNGGDVCISVTVGDLGNGFYIRKGY